MSHHRTIAATAFLSSALLFIPAIPSTVNALAVSPVSSEETPKDVAAQELGDKAINPQPEPPGKYKMINPQPEPPGKVKMINPQPEPPGKAKMINPQPEPPGRQR